MRLVFQCTLDTVKFIILHKIGRSFIVSCFVVYGCMNGGSKQIKIVKTVHRKHEKICFIESMSRYFSFLDIDNYGCYMYLEVP